MTYTPVSVGLTTANLTFTHNAAGSPTVYSVQGTGTAPAFSITPASLDFGSVPVGSNSTLQATVNNTGSVDLVISDITSSDGQFTFIPNIFPVTIIPGGSQIFDVTYTPVSVGLTTANLTFTHNAAGSPTVYSVQGTGTAPAFSITPASLDFGSVPVGSNSTLQATVNNTGSVDLVISDITSSDGQFTFIPNIFPVTITPGGSQVFDVTYAPASEGLTTANLTFTHNAAGSPTIYSVQGTGTAPAFSITPASLDFGSVPVGSNSTLQATVNNTGSVDLVISDITSSDGQFTFTPNTFPVTIIPGGSQIFDVTYTPVSVGLTTANLTFTHNAAGSPTIYSVQGTGTAPAFSITPASLDFGSVPVGSNSTLQATVNNTGTADLVVSNVASSDGQFTFTPNTFPVTITPGGSQVFDVTYAPASVGLTTANLTFTHNAAGSPTVYSVQGTGTAPAFSITPASLDFGSVPVGSNSTLQATVNNTGSVDLVISDITSSDGQFTFIPNIFPVTIVPGGSQIFDVTYTPVSVGLTTANLTFTHNAAGSPTIYSVQGTGVDVILPNLEEVTLTNVITGTTVEVPIIVSNGGSTQRVIRTNFTQASNWSISPDTAVIPAGGNFNFTLTFNAPLLPNTYPDTLVFSSDGVSSKSIRLSAVVVTDAGIIFQQDTVYRVEDNSYFDVIQLKNLTDSLHALQFRINVNKEVDDNVILTFQSIQKGSDVIDSSWILNYNIVRGPITPNGASVDSVYVLLYNTNQGYGLPPGSYNELLKVNYRVADITPLQDSLKSTMKITHAEGSSYSGLPIDVDPSRDILTVIAENSVLSYGDVNFDGCLDILDLLMVVDHILSIDSLEGAAFSRGDIAPWLPGVPSPEPNSFVNVQDMSLLQNIILTETYPNGLPLGNCGFNIPKINTDEDTKVTFYINKTGVEVYLKCDIGIRGAQIEFANVDSNPENLVISTDLGQGFYFYDSLDDILRTLMYDPQGQKFIDAGEHLLAEIPFTLNNPDEVTLDKLILVDVNKQKLENIQVDIIYGEPPLPPVDFSLLQNYPNPFNPTTTIEFSLPEDVSSAKLTIYNMLGERIAQLVNSSLQKGRYEFRWNAQNYASGMYIYELRADKFISIKKMMLLK